ncbi:MAG: glycosyltransferase family 2 protein [Actinomycetota bacterium]|nr:glycosyltransferase family 2 protein [Actinomycetota bacterium]
MFAESPPPVRQMANASVQRTLIIIPAFNEEQALPAVLKSLRSNVAEWDVLVVDDGSTDGTASAAAAGGAMVARLPFNLGIGGALRTGFRFAARMGYQRAVQFDADGQHEATEIHRLLDEVGRGADLAVGSRFAAEQRDYRVGPARRAAMSVLRVAITLLAGHRLTDTSSGFRAFSRSMLEFFASTYPIEYMDSVEALLLACYAGFRVIEVPIVMHQRLAGTPANRQWRLVYHYLRLLLVMISMASIPKSSTGRTSA